MNTLVVFCCILIAGVGRISGVGHTLGCAYWNLMAEPFGLAEKHDVGGNVKAAATARFNWYNNFRKPKHLQSNLGNEPKIDGWKVLAVFTRSLNPQEKGQHFEVCQDFNGAKPADKGIPGYVYLDIPDAEKEKVELRSEVPDSIKTFIAKHKDELAQSGIQGVTIDVDFVKIGPENDEEKQFPHVVVQFVGTV